MLDTVSVFDAMEMENTEHRVSSRRALALAHNRVENHLGRFLRGARTEDEFFERLGLVEEDFNGYIATASRDTSHEHPEHIAAALRDHYRLAAKEVEFVETPAEKAEEEDEEKTAGLSPLRTTISPKKAKKALRRMAKAGRTWEVQASEGKQGAPLPYPNEEQDPLTSQHGWDIDGPAFADERGHMYGPLDRKLNEGGYPDPIRNEVGYIRNGMPKDIVHDEGYENIPYVVNPDDPRTRRQYDNDQGLQIAPNLPPVAAPPHAVRQGAGAFTPSIGTPPLGETETAGALGGGYDPSTNHPEGSCPSCGVKGAAFDQNGICHHCGGPGLPRAFDHGDDAAAPYAYDSPGAAFSGSPHQASPMFQGDQPYDTDMLHGPSSNPLHNEMCLHCGHDIPWDSPVCEHCGQPVSEEAQPGMFDDSFHGNPSGQMVAGYNPADQRSNENDLVTCPACGGKPATVGGKCSKCHNKGKVRNFGDSMVDAVGADIKTSFTGTNPLEGEKEGEGKDGTCKYCGKATNLGSPGNNVCAACVAKHAHTGAENQNNTGLDGPEPKMDKRLWTPQTVTRPDYEDGPRHPTEEKDPTEVIGPMSNEDDPSEIHGQGTHFKNETLPTESGDKPFADNNMSGGPHTDQWGNDGQVDPVTNVALSKADDVHKGNPLAELLQAEWPSDQAVTAAFLAA